MARLQDICPSLKIYHFKLIVGAHSLKYEVKIKVIYVFLLLPFSFKEKLNQVCWNTPVIPATLEAETGLQV
jgi:hypothetical protein